MKKRILSIFTALCLCMTLLPTTVFAADNLKLTVKIEPLKISQDITISEDATYKELKNKIEQELNVGFQNDGYEIYCSDAGIHYHPSYAETLNKDYVDETKKLSELNFKTGYTVRLEKLPWIGTEENPIEIFGLKIWGDNGGAKGACEPFCQTQTGSLDFYWNYYYKTLYMCSETPITISGTAEENVKILVYSTKSYNYLTIKDLTIINNNDACIIINPSAWLYLTLKGENTLYSGDQSPAITLNNTDSWLQIEGNGTLYATSKAEGQPAIGTYNNISDVYAVNIYANGGTIIATGGKGGAGIRSKKINIWAGNLVANGGIHAYGSIQIDPSPNDTVIVTSDTQALSPVPELKNCDNFYLTASVNKDGSDAVVYKSEDNATYKYFKLESRVNQSAPSAPEEFAKTHDSITLKTIEENKNGAAVEYSKDSGSNWQDSPVFTGLTPDTEYVFVARYKETGKYNTSPASSSTSIKTKETPTYTLTASDIVFASVEYNYVQPNAEAITITNSGNSDATIASVTINDTDSFTIGGSGATVPAGGTLTTYTVQPVTGLQAGEYKATITITYNNGATTTVKVSFTVKQPSNTVVFDSTGGSTVSSVLVEYGELITKPVNPTRDDYTFGGWFTDAGCTAEWDFENDRVVENITLYAKWDKIPTPVPDPTPTPDPEPEPTPTPDPDPTPDVPSYVPTPTPDTGNTNNKNDKTETVTNPDGSTTTTEIKQDGTVVETTKKEDGSESKTETKKDGTVTETNTTATGTTSTTVTDDKGNVTESKVTVSEQDAEQETPVTLPVQDVKSTDSENAQEISVEIPEDTTVTVEIPVEDVTPGTVVIIVDEDGTETVVPTTKMTENGVSVTLEGNATIKIVENGKTFEDVNDGDYFEDAVAYASSRGITSGTSEDTFSPNDSCTRAQLVTFLWRAVGQPEATSESGMSDVAKDSYYTEAVTWAFENGIVGGYGNGQFGSEDTVTREQMAVILYRFAQKTGMDTTQGGMLVREFDDYESISGYAIAAMQWAVNAGIMQGYNNNLMPNEDCTRAQIVTMLYRFLGK